jgi:hypothetical protein
VGRCLELVVPLYLCFSAPLIHLLPMFQVYAVLMFLLEKHPSYVFDFLVCSMLVVFCNSVSEVSMV